MFLPAPAWLPAAWLALVVLAVPAWAQEQTADEVRFDVWEYQVSGNTVLENTEIERTVYKFLGPSRSIADVEAARQELEALYRDAGFGTVVVNIPEQDVEAGMVRLEVLEGRVDRLMVSGARWFSPKRIKNGAPSLKEGEVPYLPEVQAEVTRLNAASRDRRITPVLRPGRSPGAVEVDLKVDDKPPIHGSFEFNDRFTRDTTRTRLNASLSYDNLWQRQHSLTLGYQVAPEEPDDVTVFFGTYLARLASSPWLISGFYIQSDSDIVSIGTLGVLGTGQLAGLRFIRPLPSLAGGFQTATFGIDLKDFEETVRLEGNQPAIETPIKYGTLSASYDLTFLSDSGKATRLSTTAVFGTRLLGNDPLEFESKRFGAKSSFFYLGGSFQRDNELWWDTLLRITLSGQLATAPLINNEQFAFGGVTSVRGYLESQQFVDDGAAGQLELLSPDWGAKLWNSSSLRLLAFVDAGGGVLKDALPEQDDEFFLWSAGVGMRAALWRKLTAALDWAYPFRDSSDGNVKSGDARLHFNVRFAF